MSSEQARRENISDEHHIHVQKARDPKMASHWEPKAVKVQVGTDYHLAGAGAIHVRTAVPKHEGQAIDVKFSGPKVQHGQKDKQMGTITERKKQSFGDQDRSASMVGFKEGPGGVTFDQN